jgi:hypothetical protein
VHLKRRLHQFWTADWSIDESQSMNLSESMNLSDKNSMNEKDAGGEGCCYYFGYEGLDISYIYGKTRGWKDGLKGVSKQTDGLNGVNKGMLLELCGGDTSSQAAVINCLDTFAPDERIIAFWSFDVPNEFELMMSNYGDIIKVQHEPKIVIECFRPFANKYHPDFGNIGFTLQQCLEVVTVFNRLFDASESILTQLLKSSKTTTAGFASSQPLTTNKLASSQSAQKQKDDFFKSSNLCKSGEAATTRWFHDEYKALIKHTAALVIHNSDF